MKVNIEKKKRYDNFKTAERANDGCTVELDIDDVTARYIKVTVSRSGNILSSKKYSTSILETSIKLDIPVKDPCSVNVLFECQDNSGSTISSKQKEIMICGTDYMPITPGSMYVRMLCDESTLFNINDELDDYGIPHIPQWKSMIGASVEEASSAMNSVFTYLKRYDHTELKIKEDLIPVKSILEVYEQTSGNSFERGLIGCHILKKSGYSPVMVCGKNNDCLIGVLLEDYSIGRSQYDLDIVKIKRDVGTSRCLLMDLDQDNFLNAMESSKQSFNKDSIICITEDQEKMNTLNIIQLAEEVETLSMIR